MYRRADYAVSQNCNSDFKVPLASTEWHKDTRKQGMDVPTSHKNESWWTQLQQFETLPPSCQY